MPYELSEAMAFALPTGLPFWVIGESSAWASSIVKALEAKGLDVALHRAVDVCALTELPSLAGVLCLAPSFGETSSTPLAWSAAEEEAIKQLFSAARQVLPGLLKAREKGRPVFATLSQMDGRFGFGRHETSSSFAPLQGALAGLPKTLRWEAEGLSLTALDLDVAWTNQDAATQRIAALLSVETPIEVGIHAQGLSTLSLVELAVSSGEAAIAEGDVFVVTGGARGVTASVVERLAQAYRPALVLLGRSPLPAEEPSWMRGLVEDAAIKRAIMKHGDEGKPVKTPVALEKVFQRLRKEREIRKNLAKISATGAKVRYIAVDVRDAKALQSSLSEVREAWGPVRGLMHAAGVLEDRFILDKSDAQFAFVFDTKVQGLRTLLAVTAKDPVQHLVLFSSVSGRAGNKGQVDYAMANEVLNKVAQSWARAHRDRRALSANWGPWDGGMVTPALKRHFAQQGVSLIPLDGGAHALVEELGNPNAPVEVVYGDVFESSPTPTTPLPPKKSKAKNTPQPTAASAVRVAETQGVTGTKKAAAIEFSKSLTREVSLSTMPVLRDHVIGGQPVMPLALLMEWLGHGALHANPGLTLIGYEQLRVMKGVRLDADKNHCLEIWTATARKQAGQFHVPVQLRSQGEAGNTVLHAKATAILANRWEAAPKAPLVPTLDVYPWTTEEAYDEILFHGPQLQGIQKVDGLGKSGLEAHVTVAPLPKVWTEDAWRCRWLHDPMVIDCAFQLAILWCFEEADKRSLPAFAASYRQFRDFPVEGELRVCMTIRDTSAFKMRADISFVDAEDQVVACFTGYECTMDASLAQAFQKPLAPEFSASA